MIFVAAFCPVIEQLSQSVKDFPLWWALLFGACFGGNITMIGSTANIVALGMLEKRPSASHVTFMKWLAVGLPATLLSGMIVVGAILILEPHMADRPAELSFQKVKVDKEKKAGLHFAGKLAHFEVAGIRDSDAAKPAVEFEGSESFIFGVAYGKNEGEAIAVAHPADMPLEDAPAILTGTMYSVPDSDSEYPVLLVVKEAQPVKTK